MEPIYTAGRLNATQRIKVEYPKENIRKKKMRTNRRFEGAIPPGGI